MSSIPEPQRITLDAFWALVEANPDKRLEYDDGLVIEMMAGGTQRSCYHQCYSHGNLGRIAPWKMQSLFL